jgi:hypothetical protein
MSGLYDIAWQFSELLETNRSVFLKLEPEIPDYTAAAPFKVVVWGLERRVELDVTPQNIVSVIGLFDSTIFNKERVDRLYVWNLKALASYFHFYSDKFFKPSTSVIDLKCIENFLGIKKNQPENLITCINRTKVTIQQKGWLSVYKAIHLPLSLWVLPTLETTPLLNEVTRRSVFPCYEIEGQINGRLNCYNKFIHCYTPHTLSGDQKGKLKPKGYGLRFLYADFRHCEVAVLQWLSSDPVLKQMLESGADLYAQFYQLITEDTCDTDVKRKKAKAMLISVIYGSGARGLAEMLGVSDSIGAELIRRINVKLPVACQWLDQQQQKAKSEPVFDYFGRPRVFPDGQEYLARNFSVQGVAATVCQERMIELCKILDKNKAQFPFSVHDGFCLVVKMEVAREMYLKVKETLEAESKLCPGLKMKVEIKFGAKLDKMKVLWKD